MTFTLPTIQAAFDAMLPGRGIAYLFVCYAAFCVLSLVFVAAPVNLEESQLWVPAIELSSAATSAAALVAVSSKTAFPVRQCKAPATVTAMTPATAPESMSLKTAFLVGQCKVPAPATAAKPDAVGQTGRPG